MNNLKKQLFSMCMVIIMLVTMLPLNVVAAPSMTVTAGTKNCENTAGTQVEVDVTLSNNPGITWGTIDIKFDNMAFKLVSVKDTNATLTCTYNGHSNFPITSDSYTLSWDDSLATTNNTTNGKLATLVFEVLAGATSGDKVIGVDNISFTDKDDASITGIGVAGKITLTSPTPSHTHIWSTEWSSDATYHWHACTGAGTCDKGNVQDKAEHTYNQEVVNEAYLKSAATCTTAATYYKSCVCGAFSTTAGTFTNGSTTPHNLSSTYQSDENGHWQKCINAGCTYTTTKTDHSGGTATCTEKATCTACGQKYGALAPNNHTGTLGDWQQDANKHWKEYSVCHHRVQEASHSDSAWKNDVNGHWKVCTTCSKVTTAMTAHVYDDDQDTTCNTCGYERTVTPPPVNKVLESIAVTTNPTKMVYTIGENFDSAGMVVTAHYSNQTSAVVTNYSVSGGNPFAAGDASVTISYTENDVTKTTVLQLTVNQQGGEPEVGVKVTFDANGGMFADQTTSKTIALDDWHESPVPTRSNYSFDGWYTERVGGSKVVGTQRYNENTTLYAHWTYIGGDGSITIITRPDSDNNGTKENPGTGAAPGSIGYVFVGLAAVGALCFGAKKLIKKEEE